MDSLGLLMGLVDSKTYTLLQIYTLYVCIYQLLKKIGCRSVKEEKKMEEIVISLVFGRII